MPKTSTPAAVGRHATLATGRKSSGRMAYKGFPNPIDVLIGRRIRARRTVLGISQSDLGEAIGLTFQQVQKYERGANRIGVSRLIDICDALDVTPDALLGDIPHDIRGQSPAKLMGKAPAPTKHIPDPLATRRVMELARNFTRISDKSVADALYHTVKAAADLPKSAANDVRGAGIGAAE